MQLDDKCPNGGDPESGVWMQNILTKYPLLTVMLGLFQYELPLLAALIVCITWYS
jgi:hypothetical protein